MALQPFLHTFISNRPGAGAEEMSSPVPTLNRASYEGAMYEHVFSSISVSKTKHGATLAQGRNNTVEFKQILGARLGCKLLGVDDGLLERVTLRG